MVYAIDRIVGKVAVCECIESGVTMEIAADSLPTQAREGDIVRLGQDGRYIVDVAATKERRDSLNRRLQRLFDKGKDY